MRTLHRRPYSRLLLAQWLPLLLLAACAPRGNNASSATVLRIISAADADALIPPLVRTTQGKQVVDQIFDYLAEPMSPIETLGDAGFRPQLAASWVWSPDSLSIAFSINPRARWHDGQPVRAGDVQFSFALITDPKVASPHAGSFAGLDSLSVRDSLTVVAWWHARHPEQFYQLAYNLAVLPAHLLQSVARDSLLHSDFAQHPIGSGQYRFVQWEHSRDLMLIADSANYRGAPYIGRLLWEVAPDPAAANLKLLAGQSDVLESVRGDAYVQARKSATAHTVSYGSLDYGYLFFNIERTIAGTRRLFADRALRTALTQSVNRAAVVANALDSLGSVALGPFTHATATADTTLRQIAFDQIAAERTLDALGWTKQPGDSIRRHGREPLRFTVLLPSTSATRQRVAVLLQEQWRQVGVHMEIDAIDPQLLGSRLEKGDFDAALNVWRTDPSPASIRQVWGTVHGADVGANFGHYSNPLFDATLDSAAATFSAPRRNALFAKGYQLLIDDAAAVWLYEPRNIAAISNRITPIDMRADAWWAGLSQWSVGQTRTVQSHAAQSRPVNSHAAHALAATSK